MNTTVHRKLLAVAAWLHLAAPPAAGALVLPPNWLTVLPWFAVVPALGVFAGWRRRFSLTLLSLLVGIAAFGVARHGREPLTVLPAIAVLFALSQLALRRDRGTHDHWRVLMARPLDELHRMLRAPHQCGRSTPPLARFLAAALLLGTGLEPFLREVVSPDDRISAVARLVSAVGLIVPWERLYRATARRDPLLVVYDEQCLFCSATLQWMRILDPCGLWEMRSQSDLPKDLPAGDFESALFVFDAQKKPHRGYFAVRRLFASYQMLAPWVLVMRLPPVVAIGERVYTQVAARRGEWFRCGTETRP